MSEKPEIPEVRFKGFTDDWEQRKLGSLGSVSMNKRIFKYETSNYGDVPFYKISTFGDAPDSFISRELFEEYKDKYPYPEVGDILISASGSIGRTVTYQGDDEYFQDSNIVWFKHDERLDNLFLKQFYSIVKWYGLEGSTIKRLYNKNILDTDINICSLKEQIKIGSFFKLIDQTVTLHQRKHLKLQNIKKAMLEKMFPRNGNNVPEVRFAGFIDDWEQRKLGEIVKWSKGNKLPKSVLNKNKEGRSVLHYADLYKFGAVQKYVLNWSTSDQGKLIPNNSILFPMSDVTPFGLARTTTLLVQGVMAGGDVLIGTARNNILAQFLSFQINATPEKILPLVTGTTVKHINSTSLATVDIYCPCCEEQTKIGNLFKTLDDTITLHQRKLEKFKNIKKACLDKMFV